MKTASAPTIRRRVFWSNTSRSFDLDLAMAHSFIYIRDENGQPLDPTQLNLDALQNQGALPDGLGQGFTLYVNAIVQAPPPVPDPQVTLALGDTIDEGMNTIQLAGTDWNDAVEAYNTRRAQIPGEVVARVSEYFGFDLPVAFPYYQGANAGAPVQNPLATPPTPTP